MSPSDAASFRRVCIRVGAGTTVATAVLVMWAVGGPGAGGVRAAVGWLAAVALAALWCARHPDSHLIERAEFSRLLDTLEEMVHRQEALDEEEVAAWARVADTIAEHGNQVDPAYVRPGAAGWLLPTVKYPDGATLPGDPGGGTLHLGDGVKMGPWQSEASAECERIGNRWGFGWASRQGAQSPAPADEPMPELVIVDDPPTDPATMSPSARAAVDGWWQGYRNQHARHDQGWQPAEVLGRWPDPDPGVAPFGDDMGEIGRALPLSGEEIRAYLVRSADELHNTCIPTADGGLAEPGILPSEDTGRGDG